MTTPKLPNLTPSRVSALPCRKRFHAEHVAKTVKTSGFARSLSYGSAVHAMFRDVYVPTNSQASLPRDLTLLARRAFAAEPYADDALREEDRATALEMVTAYLRQADPNEETVEVEFYETLTLRSAAGPTLTLGAKFDRLLVNPEMPRQIILRDYKTGTPGTIDLEGAAIMLAILMARFKEFATFQVQYDYLGSAGLNVRHVVTREQAASAWPALRDRARRVYDSKECPAEPGEHCTFCPLRPTCRPEIETQWDELDILWAEI